ncbi:uncharacterized protein [Typha latifolia]|uniref:uncharacterized protein n=1 Tax=Typha latifolia TaxID=4733 RepID=UPI003C2C01E4
MAPDSKSPIPTLRKLMGSAVSLFRRRFNSSKCKAEAKMATARMKLLRNKREVTVRQMRRDIAMLLESGRDDTARIRVEHVIREQNVMAANEIIELFCELIVVRLPIIAKQRECPADLREGISSLIFAAPRCSEIPELSRIRDIFEKKYGKDFVSAASDLRPDSGVNRLLIEKLSVRKPTGEVKLKVLKEIAKEYQVEWDTKETEQELLKPPEELLGGPCSFVSASSIPVKTTLPPNSLETNKTSRRYCDDQDATLQFKDAASAAQAAAESADEAVYAARAAVYLSKRNSYPFDQTGSFDTQVDDFIKPDLQSSCSSAQFTMKNENSVNELKHPGRIFDSQSFNRSNYIENNDIDTANLRSREILRRNSHAGQTAQTLNSTTENEFPRDEVKRTQKTFNSQDYVESDSVDNLDLDSRKIPRRRSCSGRKKHSDIKFDDSDGLESEGDEASEMETHSVGVQGPLKRFPRVVPPPPRDHFEEKSSSCSNSDTLKGNVGSRVHPKLPDYEELAARFEALKCRRS